MKRIPVMICLAIMSLMVASCSEDSSTEGGMTTIDQMFQRMKASYRGSYYLNNIPKFIHITIDEQAHVVVDKFPLDLVFAKLYPNDYSSITEPEGQIKLDAPIKGFNLDSSYIEFSTDPDNTAPIEFTFIKDEEKHTGWALIYAIGLYNQSMGTLTMQISVVDLVIDGQDMRSLTPIHYFIDSAIKE